MLFFYAFLTWTELNEWVPLRSPIIPSLSNRNSHNKGQEGKMQNYPISCSHLLS